MQPDYRLGHEEALHTVWDNDLDPAITIESGDIVEFDCLNDSGPRITPTTQSHDLPDIEFIGHHLTGPVAIEEAEPGTVLQIDLLAVEHGEWGYTLIRRGESGNGLLPKKFPNPFIHHWDLSDDIGHFVHDIEVPLGPFPGVVGVSPATEGAHSTGPPRSVGGNMDIKHLTEGSRVYLPVKVDDALFSIGDGHAAQGDGEVCISAIETPMTVTARFVLRDDLAFDRPQFETNGPFTPAGHDERTYATTGIRPDLMNAAKDAVLSMINYLNVNHNLSRQEAYVLCSVAGDLKINEIVDEPHWVVSMYMAKHLFSNISLS